MQQVLPCAAPEFWGVFGARPAGSAGRAAQHDLDGEVRQLGHIVIIDSFNSAGEDIAHTPLPFLHASKTADTIATLDAAMVCE